MAHLNMRSTLPKRDARAIVSVPQNTEMSHLVYDCPNCVTLNGKMTELSSAYSGIQTTEINQWTTK